MGNIAATTTNYCKKGDIVGVKGRIQQTHSTIELIAEKVTFLSSHTPTQDTQDNMSKGEI